MIQTGQILYPQLLDIRDKNLVIQETKYTVSSIEPQFDFRHFERAFQDMERLFRGHYPGFRACNTDYHDFRHTLHVLLAMARLMHGAALEGMSFTEKEINLGLISALMHDTGYIQPKDDTEGTGAKYTLVHVRKSILFVRNHYRNDGYFQDELANFSDIINCTAISVSMDSIRFASANMEALGKMLGTADLLGQMADRLYLEKLIPLFKEFEEGKVPGFASEYDLFKKTSNFYHVAQTRLKKDLGNVQRFMVSHFRERWNMEKNIYQEAIDGNINYLRFVLKHNEKNLGIFLRRNAVTIQ